MSNDIVTTARMHLAGYETAAAQPDFDSAEWAREARFLALQIERKDSNLWFAFCAHLSRMGWRIDGEGTRVLRRCRALG